MNQILIRNFSNLTKNTSKTIKWERIGSIDIKLKNVSNNLVKKKDKKGKKELINVKITDYDYFTI